MIHDCFMMQSNSNILKPSSILLRNVRRYLLAAWLLVGELRLYCILVRTVYLYLHNTYRGAIGRPWDSATGSPDAQPAQNGPDRPFKMEGNAANENSSIKEIEALQQLTISLNRIKRKETVRKKERNSELYITI
jgi:hypothetical protein